jgi:hypothetical protein
MKSHVYVSIEITKLYIVQFYPLTSSFSFLVCEFSPELPLLNTLSIHVYILPLR